MTKEEKKEFLDLLLADIEAKKEKWLPKVPADSSFIYQLGTIGGVTFYLCSCGHIFTSKAEYREKTCPHCHKKAYPRGYIKDQSLCFRIVYYSNISDVPGLVFLKGEWSYQVERDKTWYVLPKEHLRVSIDAVSFLTGDERISYLKNEETEEWNYTTSHLGTLYSYYLNEKVMFNPDKVFEFLSDLGLPADKKAFGPERTISFWAVDNYISEKKKKEKPEKTEIWMPPFRMIPESEFGEISDVTIEADRSSGILEIEHTCKTCGHIWRSGSAESVCPVCRTRKTTSILALTLSEIDDKLCVQYAGYAKFSAGAVSCNPHWFAVIDKSGKYKFHKVKRVYSPDARESKLTACPATRPSSASVCYKNPAIYNLSSIDGELIKACTIGDFVYIGALLPVLAAVYSENEGIIKIIEDKKINVLCNLLVSETIKPKNLNKKTPEEIFGLSPEVYASLSETATAEEVKFLSVLSANGIALEPETSAKILDNLLKDGSYISFITEYPGLIGYFSKFVEYMYYLYDVEDVRSSFGVWNEYIEALKKVGSFDESEATESVLFPEYFLSKLHILQKKLRKASA